MQTRLSLAVLFRPVPTAAWGRTFLRLRCVRIALVVFVGFAWSATTAESGPLENDMRDACVQIEQLLAVNQTGGSWWDYLQIDELKRQLELNHHADIAVVTSIQNRFETDHSVLRMNPFALARRALRKWVGDLQQPALVDLPQLAHEAREQAINATVLPTEQAVEQALDRLGRANSILDGHLAEFGDAQIEWRRYLGWNEYVEHLQSGPIPDPSILDERSRRLDAAHPLFRGKTFRYSAGAIRLASRELRMAMTSQDELVARLDELAPTLELYALEPTESHRQQIAESVRWLQARGQAKRLIAAVQRQYGRPNLYVRASRQFMGAPFDVHSDEQSPVRENILGTSYRGTRSMRSRVALKFTPNLDVIGLSLLYGAIVDSSTTGVNGPATVQSQGRTYLRGEKKLSFGPRGFSLKPARARARTQSEIVDLEWGRLLGRQMALQRAYEEKPATERIVEARAEQEVEAELDRRASEMVRPLQDRYVREVRIPLMTNNVFPERMHFRSNDTMARISWTQADPKHLGAESDPPPFLESGDLALQIHPSFVASVAERLLASRTIEEVHLEERLDKVLGEVPKSLQVANPQQPWTITFAEERPLSIEIDEGLIKVEVRTSQFGVGETKYPGMWLNATYKLDSSQAGLVLRREGRLNMVPPGFQTGSGKRLGARQQAFRTMLRKRFEPILSEEIAIRSIPLVSLNLAADTLTLHQATAHRGWLSVVCRLPEPDVTWPDDVQ